MFAPFHAGGAPYQGTPLPAAYDQSVYVPAFHVAAPPRVDLGPYGQLCPTCGLPASMAERGVPGKYGCDQGHWWTFGPDTPGGGSPTLGSVPRPGESRVTATPDDDRSIRFEIGRMLEYIRDASKDPDFVRLVREVMKNAAPYEGRPDYQLAQVACWDAWCRENMQYVFDGIGFTCKDGQCRRTAREYIQPPGAMARQLRSPSAIGAVIAGRLIGTSDGRSFQTPTSRGTRPRIIGDCDEHAVLTASGPPIVGIETALRFGGHWEHPEGEEPFYAPHHVWSVARLDGGPTVLENGETWWDLDTTIKSFKLGQFAPFEQYSYHYVFRP